MTEIPLSNKTHPLVNLLFTTGITLMHSNLISPTISFDTNEVSHTIILGVNQPHTIHFIPKTEASKMTQAFLQPCPLLSNSDLKNCHNMRTLCSMSHDRPNSSSISSKHDPISIFSRVCATAACAITLTFPLQPIASVSAAGSMRLPPIDRTNPNRCRPSSSSIGQANAARDSLLDLRECDLRGIDLSTYDLSGAIISDADLTGAKLVDAQLSKSYAPNAKFSNVDFTNAIADRVNFDGADLKNGIFANAVLSDSTFDGANLENVDFTDVYIGDFAQRSICKNPTVKGTNPITGAPTRESLGCK